MNGLKIILNAVGILFALIFIAALLLDYANGDDELWQNYAHDENQTILGEYKSIEECTVAMNENEELTTCKRVDGLFWLLNNIASVIL